MTGPRVRVPTAVADTTTTTAKKCVTFLAKSKTVRKIETLPINGGGGGGPLFGRLGSCTGDCCVVAGI